MQMMDLREATKTLDAYSTLIAGKSRFYDQILKLEVPEETKKITAEMIAKLKDENKEAAVILKIVVEEIKRHSKQLVAGFTDELTECLEAINRSHAATAEALQVVRAHETNPKRKDRKKAKVERRSENFLQAEAAHQTDVRALVTGRNFAAYLARRRDCRC